MPDGMTFSLFSLEYVSSISPAGNDQTLTKDVKTFNTAATICVLLSTHYGFGHHFLYIGEKNMVAYIKVGPQENDVCILLIVLGRFSTLRTPSTLRKQL